MLLCCVCATLLGLSVGDVTKPSAPVVVQALNPSGLRISVPDSTGLDVVIINANINLPINEKESGSVSGSVLEARNGYWTLTTKDLTLKPGDVVFYWVYTAVGDRGDRQKGHQAIHELLDPSCGPSPTTFNGRTACAGQLIFEENFDSFNKSIWKNSIQFSDDPDNDFAIYTDNPENSFVKDGLLHLKATVLTEEELLTPTKLEKCTWTRGGAQYCQRHPMGWNILPPTRSAMVTTKGTFSFKFGRIDIRAKTAAGDWLMTRAMLEPRFSTYGRETYQSGRLELIRTRGNADVRASTCWHFGAALNDPQANVATCNRTLHFTRNCPLAAAGLYSDDMHVFTAIWTPTSIAFSVDGECVSGVGGGFLNHDYFKEDCYDSPWEEGSVMAPFDKEFYVHMSLLPGGYNIYGDEFPSHYPKPWADNKDPRAMLKFWQQQHLWFPSWKSDMEVDYVKVWAL